MASEGFSLLHIFLVSFPGQGHVNPMLRLGKRLASKGFLVTVSAPEIIGREIRKANAISEQPAPVGEGFIRFEFFDDEWLAEDDKPFDLKEYLDHLSVAGKKVLPGVIKKQEELGRPVSCIIINPMIPWVYEVAESLRIQTATLWVQSCASFSAYYHYYHGLVPFPSEKEPEIDVHLPAMPVLKHDEIPSFLHPSTPYGVLKEAILSGLFKNLPKNFCVLMDTFQDLENELIQYMSRLCPIRPIGPLFKYSEIGSSSSSGTVSIDIIKPDECFEWLSSKAASSVVYISFGSIASLKEEQMKEIAHGVLNSGLPFLWVVRPPAPSKRSSFDEVSLPDELLEKLSENGRIVKWCSQDRVLAHPSVACFLTHCGWNSTLESLASGVPVITFPQWGDQVTDAKYLVDEFKVGMRLSRGEAENRIIPREEVERCLIQATTGPEAAELKRSALRWKKMAADAVADGGCSDRHLQEFAVEIERMRMP